MKVCKTCKIIKDVICFGKLKGAVDGIRDICKQCRKAEYSNKREYYLKKAKIRNKEKKTEIKIYLKNYYSKNKNNLITASKNNYKNNKCNILEKHKLFYENNKEEIKRRNTKCREKKLLKLYGEKYILIKNKKFKNQKLTKIFLEELLPHVKINHPHKITVNDNKLKQKNLFVDFSFKIKEKLYLVEYNGRQHYELANFDNMSLETATKKLIIQKERDNWLREHSKQNNIFLLEIDGRNIVGNNIREELKNFLEKEKLI